MWLAGCGCGRKDVSPLVDEDAPEAVYELPPATSAGTLRGLGPHLFAATYDRRGDRQGVHPSRERNVRLVWAELDHYEFTEHREDDTLAVEEIRLDAELWRRTSSESDFKVSAGVPGDSLILERTLRYWDQTLAMFGEQVAYERLQDSTVEGRPVRVYRISLAPPVVPAGADGPVSIEDAANRAGMMVSPIALNGLVYIDIETGNRLLAELEGRYVPRRISGVPDPTDEVLITYRESRSPTQLPPTIAAPPPERVHERRR